MVRDAKVLKHARESKQAEEIKKEEQLNGVQKEAKQSKGKQREDDLT